ncbi:hypothetical protein D3C87_1621940 [compost metagenome]
MAAYPEHGGNAHQRRYRGQEADVHDVGDATVVDDGRGEKRDGVGQHITAQRDHPQHQQLRLLQGKAQRTLMA